MKIEILEKTAGCMPSVISVGDWIDLRLAEDIKLKAPQAHKMHIRGKKDNETGVRTRDVEFDSCIASLGVAMRLPAGFEAIVVPRSSTFKKYGIIQSNSFGVIDNSYCSGKDEWKIPMTATRESFIPKGTRIAQFRIQLSQKATIWQKIRWLFSNSIKIKQVFLLEGPERGGIGSTGTN